MYETFNSERYFFNPDYFPIDMRHIGKGFLWNKEIDETYILIIGLITPI